MPLQLTKPLGGLNSQAARISSNLRAQEVDRWGIAGQHTPVANFPIAMTGAWQELPIAPMTVTFGITGWALVIGRVNATLTGALPAAGSAGTVQLGIAFNGGTVYTIATEYFEPSPYGDTYFIIGQFGFAGTPLSVNTLTVYGTGQMITNPETAGLSFGHPIINVWPI